MREKVSLEQACITQQKSAEAYKCGFKINVNLKLKQNLRHLSPKVTKILLKSTERLSKMLKWD